MATTWITKAADKYQDDLRERRKEDGIRQRKEELEQHRLNRIATEGPDAGKNLWDSLQSILRGDVAEFNKEFGEDIMRTEARADGTFKVCLGEDIATEKVAVLNYASDTTTLRWEIFGGVKGVSLTVGLRPNSDQMQPNIGKLQFTTGNSFLEVSDISKNVISSLLD